MTLHEDTVPAGTIARASRDERWRRLIVRYRGGDLRAREQLVTELLPLVRHLATRYAGKVQREDLVQVGLLALTKAIDRFDVAQGRSLTGYALPTMLGEMRRHLRDHAWSVRVPRALQERALRVTSASQELEARLGRSPTADEVAEHLGVDVEDVVEALAAGQAYRSSSFAQRAGPAHAELTLGDTLGGDDAEIERRELLVLIGHVRHVLDERERVVLHLRFDRDLTQTAIAERIGVSQMQVSRIIRGALGKLRLEIERPPAPAAA